MAATKLHPALRNAIRAGANLPTEVISATFDVQEGIKLLSAFLLRHEPVCVLTGAGISTDSGIPDYRSPGRPPHRPLQHLEFLGSHERQQRYWARSLYGYPRIRDTMPNVGHQAINELQRRGLVGAIITQNVDGLHQRAGSQHVIDLHGRLDQVKCMNCHSITTRDELQSRLLADNKALLDQFSVVHDEAVRPDGDAVLDEDLYGRFTVAACASCGGVLKPNVVFFGGSLDPEDVKRASTAVSEASALFVVGTSLATWSAFRIVRQAVEEAKPVCVLNSGPTRADGVIPEYLRLCMPIGEVLPAALRQL
ncbi:uncharacterized protein MONBRDRAFT_15984 [Monosiga brevicollis MX1]|uniref:NAD-dependent protein deacylase SIR4 n=1 Tax=Monosiga brevicollis TaxID=81824 RepID=SIR4_MONBE|nr:uncharacterized protein MONBRDRAFT_15984 [Monosiga brevicollis MX1]A9UVV1.1 RecName: Full=NAD-dependent protein deacylase SIR4; AltName: Full=Regulatory protein SIR2 homolog 4; Flags: Precursor [Monosiga brevicollis]EDQ90654.1 predicted protein [Monosiga brevicollis MX1]|eukprot:XP_001744705.1 hypothetical protein [Monosiga brevicollis MX1]